MTIFFDFDSTLVSKESLDEVIALALADSPDRIEQTEAVAAITDKGIGGRDPVHRVGQTAPGGRAGHASAF